MACGLPVVCYDRGGQTDFLASGETGFVVKLNDVSRVRPARSVQSMPTLYLRRRASAQRNRQLVENYFIDSCAARYEKRVRSAIGRAPRSGPRRRLRTRTRLTRMCGIAGIVNADPARDSAMRAHAGRAAHRGPDGEGIHHDEQRDARTPPPVHHRPRGRPAAAAQRRPLDPGWSATARSTTTASCASELEQRRPPHS